MKPMRRLLLSFAALAALSLASCKSESRNDTAANPASNNGQAGGGSAAGATPPPGAEEISEARFQRDAQQSPDDPTAHFNLGGVYLAEGKYPEAAEEFKFVTGKNPKLRQRLADAYEKAGRRSEAARERAEFERLRPNERAKELYQQGKYEEALGDLQKVADKNAETYFVMGNALLKLNRPGEAASVFRQAV